jgi:hypothetical protein
LGGIGKRERNLWIEVGFYLDVLTQRPMQQFVH